MGVPDTAPSAPGEDCGGATAGVAGGSDAPHVNAATRASTATVAAASDHAATPCSEQETAQPTTAVEGADTGCKAGADAPPDTAPPQDSVTGATDTAPSDPGAAPPGSTTGVQGDADVPAETLTQSGVEEQGGDGVRQSAAGDPKGHMEGSAHVHTGTGGPELGDDSAPMQDDVSEGGGGGDSALQEQGDAPPGDDFDDDAPADSGATAPGDDAPGDSGATVSMQEGDKQGEVERASKGAGGKGGAKQTGGRSEPKDKARKVAVQEQSDGAPGDHAPADSGATQSEEEGDKQGAVKRASKGAGRKGGTKQPGVRKKRKTDEKHPKGMSMQEISQFFNKGKGKGKKPRPKKQPWEQPETSAGDEVHTSEGSGSESDGDEAAHTPGADAEDTKAGVLASFAQLGTAT